MDRISFEIKPRQGFGELNFGLTIDETAKRLGEAQVIEQIDEEEVIDTLILHYHDLKTIVFFEGANKSVLSCIETENTEAKLFGEDVFSMEEKQVIRLMKENGYTHYDMEPEEGENCLSYEDALIDFYFKGDKLIAVNWGVMVSDDGEIIDFQ